MEIIEGSSLCSSSGSTPSSSNQHPSASTCANRATCSGNCRPLGSNLDSKRRGEAAEAAFLHKAAFLGFSVAKPWGESDRYDFILENGARSWRVQIKSAAYSHGKAKAYNFQTSGSLHRVYTAEEIDFLIGYVVPLDVWYVFPIQCLAIIGAIRVFPSSKRSRFEKYREAWCLLACPLDGRCRKAIDVHLPCHGVLESPGPACPRRL